MNNREEEKIRTEAFNALKRLENEILSMRENLHLREDMTDFRIECLAMARDLEKMTAVTVKALESAAEIRNPEQSR